MAVRPVRWRVASLTHGVWRRRTRADRARSPCIKSTLAWLVCTPHDIGCLRAAGALCVMRIGRVKARGDRCAVALLCLLYGLFDMLDSMQRTRIAIDACTELQLGVDRRL